MNKMKTVVALCACVVAGAVFAGPGGHGGGHGPAPRIQHAPPPGGHHHHGGHHHDSFWGGVVGGVVGGIIGTAIVEPAPVVVTTPTVIATPTVVAAPVVAAPVVVQPATAVQNVWVEGRYIDQVTTAGTVIRTWQPGHYEQRTVVLQ